jgi:transposase
MEPIVEKGCGLDVGQESVVACLMTGSVGERPRKELRTFPTFTAELERMRDWLLAEGCTHVAMESTGPYWVPIYVVLEQAQHFELVVGNAQHIRNVPGRKTDVKDAEWLADLLRHGLIRKSFVPPRPFRDLRDLLRYRRALINAGSAERNRLLKLLESANIKLASVASDVFGASGMLMLKALLRGGSTPEQMAELAKGRLRQKLEPLRLALRGNLDPHHRSMLETQIRRIEAAERDLVGLDQLIDARLEPYRDKHDLLMQIPGVDWVRAAVLIAELGIDMSVFPTAKHVAAWAGGCPGNNKTGGKAKRAAARKGNVYLKTALVQAAHAAAHTKGSYFKNKYFRLRARLGAKRAALAIGHKILTAAYHMLATGRAYAELGKTYLDRRDKRGVARSLIRRLHHLGYTVLITEEATA